jgi:hypothetical protein
MRDSKAFASLSSGLLARKGQARPARRPQGFTHAMGAQDDLGWNDMGHDVPRFAGVRLPVGLAGPQPVSAVPIEAPVEIPEVLRQQDEIAREFAEPAEVAPVAAAPAEPAKPARPRRVAKPKAPVAAPLVAGRKAAFTLRLASERHLLLRLACAVQNRSAQQIVTEALDRLLADLPDVARLAAGLPHQD